MADPTGAFIVPWHYALTFLASLSAGNSMGESLEYAKQSWNIDFADGSQGTDSGATAQHGMIGYVDGKVQTLEQARASNRALIEQKIADGMLGEAAHAIQDPHAAGHEGQVWNGFDLSSVSGIFDAIQHLVPDIFPSFYRLKDAYLETREMLVQQKSGDSSKSPDLQVDGVNSQNDNDACTGNPAMSCGLSGPWFH